ncbi:MAG: phosphatase PAP2 family protein [Acidimicrobiia bacterium]
MTAHRPPTRLLVTLVLVASGAAGLLWSQVAVDGPATDLDRSVADAGADLLDVGSWATAAVEGFTWFGRFPVLAGVAGLVAAVVLVRGDRRAGLLVVVATLGAQGLNIGLKALVERPRPLPADPVFTASGFSFPSGHAMVSTAAYGAALVVLLPALPVRARSAAVVAVTAVVVGLGLSRIALEVHYLSDVVAGHLLGMAWLAVAALTCLPRREVADQAGAGAEMPAADRPGRG